MHFSVETLLFQLQYMNAFYYFVLMYQQSLR